MSRKNKQAQNDWKIARLKDVALVGAGNSAPQGIKFFDNGTYPFVRTQDVGRLHIHPALSQTADCVNDLAVESKRLKLWPEKSLLIPKSGASTFLNHRVLTAVPAYVASHLAVVVASDQVLPEYLYFWSQTVDSRHIAPENNYPSLRLSSLDEVKLSVPPVPVQERIVQILQKAAEINRKRKEALELADAILSATFTDMFGDLGQNSKNFPRKKLGDLCRFTSGGTPAMKKAEFWTDGTIPWVTPKDMKVPELYNAPGKITETALGRRSKAVDGTVLIVVRGMILVHSVPIGLVRAPLTFNQDIKGLIPNDGIPGEFLFWALRCSKVRLLQMVTTASHGTKKIDTDQLVALDFYQPPTPKMAHFAAIHRQYFEAQEKRLCAMQDAHATFSSLLSGAFTGKLTAEWEAANVGWIKQQVDLSERLPRLLLLALILERAGRPENAAQAAVLVTALMKYAFLLQMEGNGRRRFYPFIPHHYGPFAKELYADLERLQADGLVTLDESTGEGKARITLADSAHTEAALADLPDVLKEDVVSILDVYGDLDNKALLRIVYDKYPAYLKRSPLRDRTPRRQ